MRYMLREAAAVAEPRGIRIGLEPHQQYSRTIAGLDRIYGLVEVAGHRHQLRYRQQLSLRRRPGRLAGTRQEPSGAHPRQGHSQPAGPCRARQGHRHPGGLRVRRRGRRLGAGDRSLPQPAARPGLERGMRHGRASPAEHRLLARPAGRRAGASGGGTGITPGYRHP